MSYNEQEMQKTVAELKNMQRPGEATQGRVMGLTGEGSRRMSLREQSEKQAQHHTEQGQKHARAAAFFRDNPVFEEFVELLRTGAFQI